MTTKTSTSKPTAPAATVEVAAPGPKHFWPSLRDAASTYAATALPDVAVAPDNARRVLVAGGTRAACKAAEVALTSFMADAMAALTEHNAQHAAQLKEWNRTAAGRAQRFAAERAFFAAYAGTAQPKRTRTTKSKAA